MLVLYDNYDSFTYNLLHYLLQHGQEVRVIRNDRESPPAIHRLKPDGIVLSPGPCRPEASGNLMELIDYFHDKCPMLGVCLGHQALGSYFGAQVVHAQAPMHGKTSLIRHNRHPAFEGIPEETTVMRYHSLILKDAGPPEWEITARCGSGEIMAMAHRRFPLWGVQFHPESVLTPDGYQMIGNWINNCVFL